MKLSVLALLLLLFQGLSHSGLLEKPPVPIAVYHDCKTRGLGDANMNGYQSAGEVYKCKEGVIRLEGKWSEVIQNGWKYHTDLGKACSGPDYVGDEPLDVQMPSFQKWCKTPYGYELCGWNDAEEKKQETLRRTRKAPPFKPNQDK